MRRWPADDRQAAAASLAPSPAQCEGERCCRYIEASKAPVLRLRQLKHVQLEHICTGQASFQIVRDDLLHPFAGGNKLRKLDALLPQLKSQGVSDVVSSTACFRSPTACPQHAGLCMQVCCGGAQSAHTAAVACLCAEQGLRAHSLIRGERPAVPAGNLLLAGMFGSVQHVTRAEYSPARGDAGQTCRQAGKTARL